MSRNEITGDEIKSKINTKEYEDNYDRIFKKKPQSLDAAYERRAMMQGLVDKPLFDENKELVESPLWSEEEEKRMDLIGQNGPDGIVYGVVDGVNYKVEIDNSNPWCTKIDVEEVKNED